jgi:hypothetical protein
VREEEHKRLWRTDWIPWSDNNTEAFAGLHNKGKRIVLIFDEASAISDEIWKVAEGALTDEETEIINEYFSQITEERFQETFNLFGQYEFPVYQNILYFVDNEIHHRGQGYVYLRALGIEPPFFWERER